jgi:ABC-2 type transport system permease protein
MIGPASLLWLTRHETRLAWRDGMAMLQAGRGRRVGWPAFAVVVISLLLHLVAYVVVAPLIDALQHPDKASLVVMTGSAFFAWMLMLSQAMEAVTRSFYARADLDLILSSPAPAYRIFIIRIGAIAATTVAMAALLLGPFIDVAVLLGGPKFLCAYAVLVAMGSSATAGAAATTALLFRLAGPRRTRILAQIFAAVIGAGFVIGIQAVAIFSYGSLSRIQFFQSPELVAAAPDLESPLWWPVLAAIGDRYALLFVLASALALLCIATLSTARSLARNALTAVALSGGRVAKPDRRADFRRRSSRQVLRRKEWILLTRDPWLLSQSLMQLLYLLPPALLLWRNFGTDGGLIVLVPVIVMAAGQLAGGLAWIAISGEDAPDLIATAPVTGAAILRAKIEAVMGAVALPIIPFAIAMACISPFIAATTLIGAGLAAAAACAVQFFFKAQAKRSHFRRRQTSSRIATFAEAFSSISFAGAAALAAAGLWLALAPAAIAAAIILSARAMAGPRAVQLR